MCVSVVVYIASDIGRAARKMIPYPYQRAAIDWLSEHAHGLLGDAPGLGKTLEVIYAIESRYPYADNPQARFLVICNKSAMGIWKDHIEACAPSRPVTLFPSGPINKARAAQSFRAGYLVVNKEQVRLVFGWLKRTGFWAIVLDEAHHARNRKSQFTKAVRQLKSQTQFAVSATFADGDPRDLWPSLHWCWPNRYHSFWRFAERYCEFEANDWSAAGTYIGVKNVDELRLELSERLLSRTKQEVAPELPPIVKQTIWVDLSEWERRIYAQMDSEMLANLDGGERVLAPTLLAQMLRLKQIATYAAQFTANGALLSSSKLDACADLIAGAPKGFKIVVACQFRSPLIALASRMAALEKEYVLIIGGEKNIDGLIKKFQTGNASVALITIQKGGESVTLSAAQQIIMLDQTWSSIDDEQVINRIHRNDAITKSHDSVQVVYLLARDTIDETVANMVASKKVWNEMMLAQEYMHAHAPRAEAIA